MKQVIKEHTFFDEMFNDEIVLIDLGACMGEFTKELNLRYKIKKAILVEPNPNNFKLLPTNDKFILYNKLIGVNGGETIPFYEDLTSPYNGSIMFEGKNCSVHNIGTISLDEIIRENNITNIDILKVDIEGSEYKIFPEISDDILNMCKQITIEFHDFLDTSLKPKTLEIIDRVKNLGFEMITSSADWGFGTDHYDVLFYKK
jgi:FkbM family methyltransferase